MFTGHEDGRISALLSIMRETAPQLAYSNIEKNCLDNHSAFWLFHSELIMQFDAKRLSKEQYLRAFNERASLMMRLDKEILGEELFYKIFGEEGDFIEELINPDIFFDETPTEDESMRYG